MQLKIMLICRSKWLVRLILLAGIEAVFLHQFLFDQKKQMHENIQTLVSSLHVRPDFPYLPHQEDEEYLTGWMGWDGWMDGWMMDGWMNGWMGWEGMDG